MLVCFTINWNIITLWR